MTIYRYFISDGGHLEFLQFMGFWGKIQLGTISKNIKYVLSLICANFGAAATKPTIISHICLAKVL